MDVSLAHQALHDSDGAVHHSLQSVLPLVFPVNDTATHHSAQSEAQVTLPSLPTPTAKGLVIPLNLPFKYWSPFLPDHSTIISHLQLLQLACNTSTSNHVILILTTLQWFTFSLLKMFRCLNIAYEMSPGHWASSSFDLPPYSCTFHFSPDDYTLAVPKGLQDFSCLHWLFRRPISSTEYTPVVNS